MTYQVKQSRTAAILVTMLAILQLTACGGGGGGSSDTASVVSSGVAGTGTSQPYDFSLNWTAPSTRADGSPMSLSDIAGYRVYYGSSAGSYPNSVNVTDGSQTSVTVAGVMAGTYHVVMTTYDINGLESPYSQEIMKTAQ